MFHHVSFPSLQNESVQKSRYLCSFLIETLQACNLVNLYFGIVNPQKYWPWLPGVVIMICLSSRPPGLQLGFPNELWHKVVHAALPCPEGRGCLVGFNFRLTQGVLQLVGTAVSAERVCCVSSSRKRIGIGRDRNSLTMGFLHRYTLIWSKLNGEKYDN